jgi:HAD superfamily hydrolase (TIGR01450 family)
MTAYNVIILAAGIGSRLQPLTDSVPKPLIQINNKPIIFYQLEALSKAPNINKVTIVTGYLANVVEKEVNAIDWSSIGLDIEIVVNDDYKTTNNMYSLFLALKDEDLSSTIIMNGDVIYDYKIFQELIANDKPNLIATDTSCFIEESMKIIVDDDLFIQGISKGFEKEEAYGVSIDLYKFSKEAITIFTDHVRSKIQSGQLNQWTEVAIDELVKSGKIKAQPFFIGKNFWWEIDDLNDLKIAETLFRRNLGVGSLLEKKVFVFDFDGTLVLGDLPTPGTLEFIALLKRLNKSIVIISNNSSRGVGEYRELASSILGIDLSADEVFTSTQATIDYLHNNDIKSVFPVATKQFVLDLEHNDISIDETSPDAVVVGFDTELTYAKLSKATLFLRSNLPYIATHLDTVCPTPEGMVPDAGAILALLNSASGRQPDAILGKPNTSLLFSVVRKLGFDIQDTVMIGDRLYTDILMGVDAGATTILVLTGDSDLSDISKSITRPDYVFQDINELLYYWKKES